MKKVSLFLSFLVLIVIGVGVDQVDQRPEPQQTLTPAWRAAMVSAFVVFRPGVVVIVGKNVVDKQRSEGL